jgi:ribose transport system ATP-binding protein
VGRVGQPLALEAWDISKRFGGTLALDGVGISLLAGEIHALLGENGSGKSTLIKVLAGYHAPEPGGKLEVAGRPVELPLRTGEARPLGLRFVHQDLGLIPSLSVLENLRLEEIAAARGPRIRWRTERARAAATLARFDAKLDPRVTVGELRPAERAVLAIVRAVDAMPPGGVLVLDEPTAFLPAPERESLFALVRRIARQGSTVLLVSHDLDEARQLADRVTVLRDGRNVGTVAAASVKTARLVEMVVGQALGLDSAPAVAGRDGQVRLRGLSGDVVRDLSLELHDGELLGVTGLPGSGYEELPYLLSGARRPSVGRLFADKELDLATLTPGRALEAGIALLPADRERDGAVGSLSLEANVSLPVLDRFGRAARLHRRRLRREVAEMLDRHDVRPADPDAAFETLSGGNQQKALLAKWLQTGPRLLLLDEPTRGVDVAARRRIVAALRELAGRGVSVICASADHEQLADLCERVLIFSGGRATEELAGDDVTRERIAERCHSLSG